MKRCLIIFLLAMVVCVQAGELELASPFSEHMVLQRQMPVPVWGWAESGAEITVKFAGQTRTAKAGKDGKWIVRLASMEASSTPCTLQVSDFKSQVSVADVLVGEVWICSGQSNMQMGANKLKDYETLLAAAQKRPIRSLEVRRTVRFTPQERFSGEWVAEPSKSAVGFMFAYELQQALDVPVGIIQASWGSSCIEGWLPLSMTKQLPHFKREMEAFEKFDRAKIAELIKQDIQGKKRVKNDDIYMRTRPNIIYNAMMHPIAPFAVRGLVWYQGEANSATLANMRQYGETLPLWCKHLRELWGRDDFYFYAVMLPRFGRIAKGSPVDSPTAPDAYSWAWFRESQQKLLALPNTGIANTIDLGEMKNIHPKDKEPVGKRLALLAQKQIHGQNVVEYGPTFTKLEKKGDTLRIRFRHAEGLRTTDGQSPREFWVAGADRKWQPAQAGIDGDSIMLSWEGKIRPDAVRYAFSAFPDVNLVNGAGLPAMPFRSDTDVPPGYNDEPSLVCDKHRRK